MKQIFFLFLCLLHIGVFAEETSKEAGVTLTINIIGIKENKGLIRVGVFKTEADYKQKNNQFRQGSYPAEGKSLTVEYQQIPAGTYAIIVYHDINNNDQNDSNAIGIPREPFGFSNNIIPGLTLPAFEKTKFEVSDKNITTDIRLQTFRKRWSVGAATIVSSSPYVDRKPRLFGIPIITYQGDNLAVMGPQATYSFYKNSHFNFSMGLKVNFEGYNESDSDFFNGMSDRKLTLEGGLEVQYNFMPKWNLKLDAYHDLLGINNGFRSNLSVSRSFGPYKWKLTPSLGLRYESQNYVDYYYGVQESESNSERPEYHPDFSVIPYLSCSWLRFWGENWVSMVTVSGTYLDKEIQDSPLIEGDYSVSFVAAFAYRF
jgi:outer membrane protein